MKKHLANSITAFRILCSILLLFFLVFSLPFYTAYILCGASDMVDGTIARKTNSAGEFGAKFDTVADFVFVAAALIKLLPSIRLPNRLCIWITFIAAMKAANIVLGIVYKKTLISVHTIMNKITGLLLFLLPLTLQFIEIKYSSPVLCAIATFSAIQEGYYIVTDQEIF